MAETENTPVDNPASLLTTAQVAAAFNVTNSAVQNWAKDGCPIAVPGKRGQSHKFSLEQVKAWKAQQAGANLDPQKERARKDRASADGLEIRNEMMLGNLLDRDSVVEHWADMVGACRAKLLSLPTKLATMAVASTNLEEIQRGAEQLVKEALEELAGDPCPSTGDLDSTAEPDGEPVGGPVPEVESGSERRTGSVAD